MECRKAARTRLHELGRLRVICRNSASPKTRPLHPQKQKSVASRRPKRPTYRARLRDGPGGDVPASFLQFTEFDKDEDTSENEYEVVARPACTKVHLVNRKAGKPLAKREVGGIGCAGFD